MLVADLLMGGMIRRQRPHHHFFVDNMAQVRSSLQRVMRVEPKQLWVGHFGPLEPAAIRQRFVGEIDLQTQKTVMTGG